MQMLWSVGVLAVAIIVTPAMHADDAPRVFLDPTPPVVTEQKNEHLAVEVINETRDLELRWVELVNEPTGTRRGLGQLKIDGDLERPLRATLFLGEEKLSIEGECKQPCSSTGIRRAFRQLLDQLLVESDGAPYGRLELATCRTDGVVITATVKAGAVPPLEPRHVFYKVFVGGDKEVYLQVRKVTDPTFLGATFQLSKGVLTRAKTLFGADCQNPLPKKMFLLPVFTGPVRSGTQNEDMLMTPPPKRKG